MRGALVITALIVSGCTGDDRESARPRSLEPVTDGDSLSTPTTGCHRTSTLVLSTLTDPAPGFDLAPIDLVDGATGLFEGALESMLGEVDGHLDVDDALGQVRAITQEGVGCSNYYEVAFAASLSVGDDLLATSFAALLQARSREDVRFVIRLPEHELDGRLMPEGTDFSVEHTELRVTGRYLGDSIWEGDLDWTHEADIESIGSFTFFAN